jgi:rare lipoprotein A
MGKMILSATFVLSLIASTYSTSLAKLNYVVINIPPTLYSIKKEKTKKSARRHLNPNRIITKPFVYLTGIASWYGNQFQGSRTASGVPFNTFASECAMRYTPLFKWVTVTNLANGRKAQCHILDRGPFVIGRIIDLSYAVKLQLKMRGGLAYVSVKYH